MLYKRVVRLLQHEQITAQRRQLARQTGPSFSGGALTDVTGRLPKTSYCGHSTVEAQHWSTWWMSDRNQSSHGFIPALNSCMGRLVRGEKRCGHCSRCLSGFHPSSPPTPPPPPSPSAWSQSSAASCRKSTTNICRRSDDWMQLGGGFPPPPVCTGKNHACFFSLLTLMGFCTF